MYATKSSSKFYETASIGRRTASKTMDFASNVRESERKLTVIASILF